jgi:hypothetical protein
MITLKVVGAVVQLDRLALNTDDRMETGWTLANACGLAYRGGETSGFMELVVEIFLRDIKGDET